MSYPEHLIKVNSTFYYKAKVPVDLRQHFPCSFIKKSLRTKDIRAAKTMLVAFEYKTHRTFSLIRSGMLPDEVVKQVVSDIVPVKGKQEVTKGKVLADIIPAYSEAKKTEWTDKTKMEVTGVFKLLNDLIGDVEISTITRPMVLELRSTLKKLPPNMYKKYPGKSIKQVLAMKDVESMSTKSVNKHISRLGSLLKYCVDEGMISNNPALGLKISEKKRADEERDAYSFEDVRKIVSNLPNDPATPERYWIPLIGLYSGMRLNEICQLYVADIVMFDGIWCFSINAEKDKRVKNESSERVIPIHPTLINLGLLNYVDNLRSNSVPRLWMNLTYCKINGYGNSFGKWYQRFNREYVTDYSLKVFHSMRHLVTNTLKQAGVIEPIIAELVGHSNGESMTMGRYGKRYQPKVILEALEKLDYGVILSPTPSVIHSTHE